MKICYFHYLYDIKDSSVGASAHVKEIVHALRQRKFDIHEYGLNEYSQVNNNVSNATARGLLKRKFSKYLNATKAILFNAKYVWRERTILFENRPDMVFIRYNIYNFSLAVLCSFLKIPFILEINAPMAYERQQFSAKGTINLILLAYLIERLNIRLATKVMVVSNELKQYYLRWKIPANKIIVNPNGANEKVFHSKIAAADLKKKLNPDNKTVIGFIGSFHYWHGMDNIQKMIKDIIQSADQNVAFLLVGSGPLKEELEQQVMKSGLHHSVIFTGYLPHREVPQYLAVMDIVLAPYPKLDFFYYSPLKIFEYMAAGKAVVAAAIGQIKEMIHDGENGLLYPPDDFEMLRQKTLSLVQDRYLVEKIGQNARKTILSNFTWNHSVDRMMQAIQSAVE